MKILHIINNLGPGGAEKLIQETLPLIKGGSNFEVEVLLLSSINNVFEEKLIDMGIKVTHLKRDNIKSPLNIVDIRNFLLKNEFNLVHCHLFPTIYWVAIAVSTIHKNKPKLVITEHNTTNRRRNFRFLRIIEKIVYSKYNKIISISDGTQSELVEWLKPSSKEISKFVTISNGVDTNRFKLATKYRKQRLNSTLDDSSILLCMVGSFTPQKDQDTIIRSLIDLENRVKLILVGEGERKNELLQLCIDLQLHDRVYFLDYREDVDCIFKTCDIVIQSSNWEGFGLTAVESMAAGRPVIASNVLGLENIVDGYGQVFERGNVVELVKCINKLINDKEFYEYSCSQSITRAKEFDIHKMVDQTVHLYMNLLS